MKYMGLGLCIFAIVGISGIYWGTQSESSFDDALIKSERALLVTPDNISQVSEVNRLKLIASSPMDGSAVVKEPEGSIVVLKEGDPVAVGTAEVEKITSQSIIFRSLDDGDLTVIYLDSLDQEVLRVSSIAQIDSETISSSN